MSRSETMSKQVTIRCAIRSAAMLALVVAPAAPAQAQEYPTKPVRIVVTFAPGGSNDLIARLVAAQLTERVGKVFTVDNRAGAGGSVGAEHVLNAPGDGYTLLNVSMAHAVNPHIYKLKYSMMTDFVPVASIAQVASVLTVHPSVPVNSVKELIALDKVKPGSINIGHAGIGTFQHLSVANLQLMAGTKMVEVPFKGGGPALVDVLGGHTQAINSAAISVLPHIKSGKLRGLGSTGLQRHPLLPDIPTVAEAGVPGYSAVNWIGLMAPKGTPGTIVDKLNKEVAAALGTPAAKEAFAKDASEIVLMSPSQFGKFVADETEKWGKVVRAVGMKAE